MFMALVGPLAGPFAGPGVGPEPAPGEAVPEGPLPLALDSLPAPEEGDESVWDELVKPEVPDVPLDPDDPGTSPKPAVPVARSAVRLSSLERQSLVSPLARRSSNPSPMNGCWPLLDADA